MKRREEEARCAALYARVSTDAQFEEGYSVEAQKEMLEAYCKSRQIQEYEFCVDGGFSANEPVDVVVRPEDVDVVLPENGMLVGTVTGVTFKGVHWEIIVDIGGFKWMIQTTDYVGMDARIGLYIEPDAIHIMKKSEFSGMFGDYSTFSDEMDELSNPDFDGEEEEAPGEEEDE